MITDWDDAYANAAHIPGGDGYPARWEARGGGVPRRPAGREDAGGDRLRAASAAGARPVPARGRAGAGSSSSSTAATGGPFDRGPGRISPAGRSRGAGRWRCRATCSRPRRGSPQITAMIAAAIGRAAAAVAGPLRLAGHSAGGHLVARRSAPRAGRCRRRCARRVDRVVLDQRRLRPAPAAAHRAERDARASIRPRRRRRARRCSRRWRGAAVHAWVGDGERPEFVRQSALIANVWTGLGADIALTVEPRAAPFQRHRRAARIRRLRAGRGAGRGERLP